MGHLPSLHIMPTLSVVECLFENDMGNFLPIDPHNFTTLQNCIIVYEQASRAKLNLSKLVVIPLGVSLILEWLKNMGCIIKKLGEIMRYLGAPIDVGLSNTQVQDYCLDKVGK